MTWLGFILRNLLRRPGRTLFTLAGVALAIGGHVILSGLSGGLADASRASLDERGIHLVVIQRGMVEFFGSVLPQSLAAQVAAVPGVAATSAELGSLAPAGDDAHVIAAGWSPDSFQWARMPLVAGRLPRPDEPGVVLSEALAETFRRGVGDTVEINHAPLTVTGIAAYTGPFNRGLAVMPLAVAQATMAREGYITMVTLQLAAPGDRAATERVSAALAALRSDLQVVPAENFLSNNQMIAMVSSASGTIAWVALALGCLIVLNTLAMAVEERGREIGILAAIGWSRTAILGAIVGEGAAIAAVGGAIGTVAGWFGSGALHLFVITGATLSAPASLSLVVSAEATAVAVGMLGALYPAWRAARLSPAAALRRS